MTEFCSWVVPLPSQRCSTLRLPPCNTPNLFISLKSNWSLYSIRWNSLAENGPFSTLSALMLSTNQCTLINNPAPHHSSVSSFLDLLSCNFTNALRADSAAALSTDLIQSAVVNLQACFLLPCPPAYARIQQTFVFSPCLCASARLVFLEPLSAVFPLRFVENVSHFSIFQSNRTGPS